MTNPINMNNFSQSLNIATATGDEVVSLDKHITTSTTDTDQIQAFIVSTWMALDWPPESPDNQYHL
ncbi:hypothetical protein QPB98_004038, partial [Escherichia coli]|nr:hypothetical protein [Escherichia coli]